MAETDWANEDCPFRVRYRRSMGLNRPTGASLVYCASEAEAETAATELKRLRCWAVRIETKGDSDES